MLSYEYIPFILYSPVILWLYLKLNVTEMYFAEFVRCITYKKHKKSREKSK